MRSQYTATTPTAKSTPPHEAVSAWRVYRPGSSVCVCVCVGLLRNSLKRTGPHSTPINPSDLAGEALLVPVGPDGREVGSHDGSVTALARWGKLVKVVLLAVWLAILLIEVEVVLFKWLATQRAEEVVGMPGLVHGIDAALGEERGPEAIMCVCAVHSTGVHGVVPAPEAGRNTHAPLTRPPAAVVYHTHHWV